MLKGNSLRSAIRCTAPRQPASVAGRGRPLDSWARSLRRAGGQNGRAMCHVLLPTRICPSQHSGGSEFFWSPTFEVEMSYARTILQNHKRALEGHTIPGYERQRSQLVEGEDGSEAAAAALDAVIAKERCWVEEIDAALALLPADVTPEAACVR